MLSVIDLFCGAGGFSQGFKEAGFDVILGIDNAEHKLSVYKKNIHADTLNADISLLHGYEIAKKTNGRNIDIIIGSPPCKDFSTCKPSERKDTFLMEASNLGYHFLRIVFLLKPSWFIMENVIPFYQTLDGEFSQALCKILGYDIAFLHLNAANLGVPQNRERGFLVGTRLGLNPTLNLPDKPTVSIHDAISDLEEFMQNSECPVDCIQLDEPQSKYQKLMRNNENKVKNHIPTEHSEEVIGRISTLREGETHKDYPNYRRPYYNDVSHTITTRFDTPSGQGESIHPKLNRCFTPREAARLQSFKDSFEFFGYKKELIREQIGDAVPPLVAYEIALAIKKLM